MWIICGILSVIFCIVRWIMSFKKHRKAIWASVCSLTFVSLTLLAEYRLVLDWVNKQDWSALLDAVPSMFPILTGYVIIMLIANILPIVAVKNKKTDN